MARLVLLSLWPAEKLAHLLEVVVEHGHQLLMLVTAPGYNHALRPDAFNVLGQRVGEIAQHTELGMPVLVVHSVSQFAPFIESLNPDVILTLQFPYELTPRVLRHPSRKINLHPTPLPLYKGSNVVGWMIRQQVRNWAISFHYMQSGYDTGNIIDQPALVLEPPITINRIFQAIFQLTRDSLPRIIERVLAGYEGTPQRPLEPGEPEFARPFTQEERTISPDMSPQDILILVEACSFSSSALFFYNNTLYSIPQARILQTPDPKLAHIGDSRRTADRLNLCCQGGHVQLILRTVL